MAVDDLMSRFSAGYDFPLDDYQLAAAARIAEGAGVLVAAPTGAGKTVVGEFACWMAIETGIKCFYTTPIKALSNQKFHDLVARHGADAVGLLTGDLSINSEAQIVVMTTEVLRNMIYAGSETLRGLRYVVMDEVHYLADRFRGAVWEEVILGLAPSVQLVSLSATVSNAEEFGEWLDEVRGDVAVIVSEKRPVPLHQHIMVGREIVPLFEDGRDVVNPKLTQLARQEAQLVRDDSRRPRGFSGKGKRNSAYGSGQFGGAASGRFNERAERRNLAPSRGVMVDVLHRAKLLPAIVFVFSRAGCDGAVRQLLGTGTRLTNQAEAARLREIAERHATGLNASDKQALGWDSFVEALSRGIAAHHAGLLPAFKAIVEEGFTRGLIKVVFATETLALGINMPAKTVVIEKLVKYNGETHADITPGEFTQLTGRAGRRGIDIEGHAVVLWQTGIDPRAVAGLASTRTYPLRSSFAPTYNMAVNMVATAGRTRARALLEQSFAQFQTDRTVVGMARQSAVAKTRIDELMIQATCELGDFDEYARLRAEISALEAEAARARKQDKRAEILEGLFDLEPGDIVGVTAGKHKGWAVVIDPGVGRGAEPHPQVMTEKRLIVRLTAADFNEPVQVLSRLRIPKKFDPKSAASRKGLSSSFAARLGNLDTRFPRRKNVKRDAELVTEIERLRTDLVRHPCHDCPEREEHARFAEQALRLERETTNLGRRASVRANSIATKFDKICGVLASLGYLDENDQLTDAGRLLTRIYSELDLVVAEAIRGGVFDELDVPALAAVLSSLVYESRPQDLGRTIRMPDRPSEIAQSKLRDVWRQVGLVERDHRIEKGPAPDIGFAEAAYAWAKGDSLADVLLDSGLPAGDFVRWVRQVIDLASQLAVAPGVGDLRARCREVVWAMRRGIVDFEFDATDE